MAAIRVASAAAAATDLCRAADVARRDEHRGLEGERHRLRRPGSTPWRPHPGQRASPRANLRKLMTGERNQGVATVTATPRRAGRLLHPVPCRRVHRGGRGTRSATAVDVLTIEINSRHRQNPLIFPDDVAHLEGATSPRPAGRVRARLPWRSPSPELAKHLGAPASKRLVNGCNLSNLPKFLTEETEASIPDDDRAVHGGPRSSPRTRCWRTRRASTRSPPPRNQEDHNSMGSILGAQAPARPQERAARVLGIELMVAAGRALDMARSHPKTGKPMVSGKGVEAAAPRGSASGSPGSGRTGVLSGDIAAGGRMLEDGSLLEEVVEKGPGPLKMRIVGPGVRDDFGILPVETRGALLFFSGDCGRSPAAGCSSRRRPRRPRFPRAPGRIGGNPRRPGNRWNRRRPAPRFGYLVQNERKAAGLRGVLHEGTKNTPSATGSGATYRMEGGVSFTSISVRFSENRGADTLPTWTRAR